MHEMVSSTQTLTFQEGDGFPREARLFFFFFFLVSFFREVISSCSLKLNVCVHVLVHVVVVCGDVASFYF